MNEYIIFGDYKETSDAFRSDFKVFDFAMASNPKEALTKWKSMLKENGEDIEGKIEQEVYVMEVKSVRFIFDSREEKLLRTYQRRDF